MDVAEVGAVRLDRVLDRELVEAELLGDRIERMIGRLTGALRRNAPA
jgi:hypothetical protein